DHMVDMLDVFTNLLTSFPDGWATYSLEILLGLVKLVAHAAETSLPGLAAMAPDNYIKHVLNANAERCPTAYAAAAAEYQPDPSRDNAFFTGRFATYIIDRVFTENGQALAN